MVSWFSLSSWSTRFFTLKCRISSNWLWTHCFSVHAWSSPLYFLWEIPDIWKEKMMMTQMNFWNCWLLTMQCFSAQIAKCSKPRGAGIVPTAIDVWILSITIAPGSTTALATTTTRYSTRSSWFKTFTWSRSLNWSLATCLYQTIFVKTTKSAFGQITPQASHLLFGSYFSWEFSSSLVCFLFAMFKHAISSTCRQPTRDFLKLDTGACHTPKE